jgi:ABC transporter with metal-binding/Fe-S-binding domain ATP-binding protein
MLGGKMKAAVLFSGGKDSCLALLKASKEFEIKYLLSLIPETEDSFMFHRPDIKLLKEQARQLGLSLIIQKTKGEKEKELKDLENLIRKVRGNIEVIVIGGIASNYQGERITKIVENLGMKASAPLWGYTSEQLWEEMLNNKFKVILTKISCEGIQKGFLGKVINKKTLDKLRELAKKYKFRIDFEGGEAESAVLYMPLFKKEIKLKGEIISEGNHRHFYKIEEVLV